jgi:6-phosphogluconolactonase
MARDEAAHRLPSMMPSLLISSGSATGLFRVTLDSDTGQLELTETASIIAGATWISCNANGSRLYATLEGNSHVAAIAVDPTSGELTLLNTQPAGGLGPCHLTLDNAERMLIVACYNGGTVSAFPILADGRLGERSARFAHQGTGPDLPRQERAHTHSVTVSPDNRFCYVCDLTLDGVMVYRIGPNPGELLAPNVPPGRIPPGHGPRHAKISRDARFLYVLNELQGSVSIFAINAADGALTALDTTTTLPADHVGFNNCSELRLHPIAERWLYAANRGPNSIAHFERDADSGLLNLSSITPTGGDHPRNFTLSPDGRWLICANRHANEVVTFAIDASSGALIATPHRCTVPDPCCVLFAF